MNELFGRKKKETWSEIESGIVEADAALEQANYDYEYVQQLVPEVEATVVKHRKLQQENHFAERLWLAYRGEA